VGNEPFFPVEPRAAALEAEGRPWGGIGPSEAGAVLAWRDTPIEGRRHWPCGPNSQAVQSKQQIFRGRGKGMKRGALERKACMVIPQALPEARVAASRILPRIARLPALAFPPAPIVYKGLLRGAPPKIAISIPMKDPGKW